MNTIPNPYPNPVTKGYGEMTVEELRTELARLDEIVIKQDVQLRRLTQGIQAIGADLGTIVIAHMQGDSKSVVAQLDGIVNKRVSVAATGSKAVH